MKRSNGVRQLTRRGHVRMSNSLNIGFRRIDRIMQNNGLWMVLRQRRAGHIPSTVRRLHVREGGGDGLQRRSDLRHKDRHMAAGGHVHRAGVGRNARSRVNGHAGHLGSRGRLDGHVTDSSGICRGGNRVP